MTQFQSQSRDQIPDGLVSNSTYKWSRKIFWQTFLKIGQKIWPLQCSQDFPFIWPGKLFSFSSQVTQFWACPVYSHSDQLSWELNHKHGSGMFTSFSGYYIWWPSFWQHVIQFYMPLKIIKVNAFRLPFILIELKLWPLQYSQGFCFIWLGDLVFLPHDPDSNLR